MKKNFYSICILFAVLFSSCEGWLNQEDSRALSTSQAYSSIDGISSVVANLYSRLKYEQNIGGTGSGSGLMDISRWDECSQNSAYWEQAGNVGREYRNYYDYNLVRDINIHIRELTNTAIGISEEQKRYFLAEARYMRAFTYFTMVTRMGGVPLITEAFDYTENTIELARPRNKEAEVYDFIASEVDEVVNDLKIVNSNVKTRATAGTALALKCRAMLYAGSLGYNEDRSKVKGLILPSGAVGIPKERANEYFQKCIDAYLDMKELGYSLYKANSDLAKNYNDLFQSSKGNSEIIFCLDNDGVNFKNFFTTKTICSQMHSGLKTGCELGPNLNQVDAYERLSSRTIEEINPYNGPAQTESMADGISTLSYKVYDNPEDIFADRDPRLNGAVILPGSSFRGVSLDFQAGLAIRKDNGTYEFKTIPNMEVINTDANYFNGERLTGVEGPHRTSTYICHTGFLMRKFTDINAGSEAEGASKVPYIIFRYGEVLLNVAEAAFCLSENGVAAYKGQDTRMQALSSINEVRERAGGTAFRLANDELNFTRIINERRVELVYEDHRYNDLKRWRIADEVWAYDQLNETSIMKGLWPYKIYAPGSADNGKWIYRKVKLEHRGTVARIGDPLNFDNTMYYASYPMTAGNPYIEKNPNH